MARTHLIKPVLDHEYPMVAYAKGVFIYDSEGKRYLDGCSGAVSASIGHGVDEVIAAMKQQADLVSFVYRSQFTNEPAEKLAKKLSEISPGDLNWVFFVNSGSEATETAMKIAVQYWQEKGFEKKNKVLSRWMSYHGITLGALSMSGHVLRRKRFVPLLDHNPCVNPPYCYRCPLGYTYPECKLACARELELAITRMGAENIAGFIAEPIIGAAGGAVTPPEGYYQEIKRICEKYNILFIADEVMTGIARTGRMFGVDHWGVVPDIMALGKGMSAGYTPMAATLVSDQVMDPILQGSKSIMAGHTYSANPQSAAVSLAVLQYIEKNNLMDHAVKMGDYLYGLLKQLRDKYLIIGDVRGKGLLLGIELVANAKEKVMFAPALGVTSRLIDRAQKKGLLIYPAAGGAEGQGDAIIISPPLSIQPEEVDLLVSILDEVIGEMQLELQT